MMRSVLAILALAALLVGLPRQAAAAGGGGGLFELSIGLSFSRSTYSEDNISWNRKWGFSAGYHFSDRSEIEFAFQDIFDRTKIVGYEDTSFHDQIYSLNWVQALTGKDFPVQPYLKAGIGQLNRDAEGTYANGSAPLKRVDSVTGVLAAGLRIYISRSFAIRTEATSYLSGGSFRTWQDNVIFTAGGSFYF